LVSEAGTYEGLQRSFTTLSGDHSNPHLWDWRGTGDLYQGLATSLLTFGVIKSAGYLGRQENLVFQHMFQSGAMVTSHQIAAAFSLIGLPTGSFGEQLMNAEITNLQMGSAQGLLSLAAPGLSALERGLDLTIRSKEKPAPSFPQVFMVEATAGEKILAPGKAPSEDSPLLMMSKGGGGDRPSFELIQGGASGRADEIKIRELFAETASSTSYPHFRNVLENLVHLQEKNWNPGDSSARDLLLNGTLQALDESLRSELGHLNREDWNILTLGLSTLGSHILREAPKGNRVGPFCRLLADFVRYTHARPDFENDPQHFFRDRQIAQALISLKGFLKDSVLDPAQKTALAGLLVRMGIARGSLDWPEQGMQLPQVDQALQEFLGITRAQVRQTGLMASASWFQSAKSWRGSPLGHLEYSLAYYLDHWSADHGIAKAGAFHYAPPSEAVSQLRMQLSATPLNVEIRRMMLGGMIGLADLPGTDFYDSPSLAKFLKRALESQNSGESPSGK